MSEKAHDHFLDTYWKETQRGRKEGFKQWDNIGTRTCGCEPATYEFRLDLDDYFYPSIRQFSGTDFQAETLAAKAA